MSSPLGVSDAFPDDDCTPQPRDTSPAGATPFCVLRLGLTDFRNYAAASIALGPGLVVLTGANGAGKTNLLEAISLLTPGRGLRSTDLGQLSRGGPEAGRHWAVSARIALGADALGADAFGASTPDDSIDEAVAVGTGLDPDSVSQGRRAGRIVRIDGETVPVSRLHEVMAAIWLTPSQDGLFTGPDGDRRRFFDRLTSTIIPAHTSHLNAFEKLTRQRNKLLDDHAADPVWLAAIERDMAGHAVAIADARGDVLARLTAAETQRQAESALFPPVGIDLRGTVESALTGGTATSAEDQYRAALQDQRRRDAAAGRTLEGPHRSELVITHLRKDMPAALCSTGEQKALLVGLTLAHARILRRERAGRMPALLLDEVTAHLDDIRREALFDTVARMGGQVLMTGTDRAAFAPVAGDAQTLDVSDAALAEW
jgi:DNA replication and repair protein RecF